VAWNKGSAVQEIIRRLGRPNLGVVYLGDDRTDEDAFAVLPDGITVHVGDNTQTAASYQLRDPDDVEQFLSRLLLLAEQLQKEITSDPRTTTGRGQQR
jgi:trehalose 6-phosphate phosphatase